MITHTTWGLESPRELNWRLSGLCAEMPDLWSSDSDQMAAAASHICRYHCPVAALCHADAQQTPVGWRRGMVLGGLRYNRHGVPAVWQPVDKKCARCETLADPGERERRRRQWRESKRKARAGGAK